MGRPMARRTANAPAPPSVENREDEMLIRPGWRALYFPGTLPIATLLRYDLGNLGRAISRIVSVEATGLGSDEPPCEHKRNK